MLQLNTHTPYVCGFAWSDMVHGCMVYTELAPRWLQFHVAPWLSKLFQNEQIIIMILKVEVNGPVSVCLALFLRQTSWYCLTVAYLLHSFIISWNFIRWKCTQWMKSQINKNKNTPKTVIQACLWQIKSSVYFYVFPAGNWVGFQQKPKPSRLALHPELWHISPNTCGYSESSSSFAWIWYAVGGSRLDWRRGGGGW